jgi:hypothetical protein
MKRLVCIATCLLVAGNGFAQTDSTSKTADTVKVGNFIIIKKNRGNSSAENIERYHAEAISAPTGGSWISVLQICATIRIILLHRQDRF